MNLKFFEEADLQNQSIIMRVDYNVPMKDGQVADNTRIVESLATIKGLLAKNCKLVLMSHLGRPDGQIKPEFSLAPVAQELEKLLGQPVQFLKECIGPDVEAACQNLQLGQVALLENLRFHAEEEKNDTAFSASLAKLGKIYVNDAFGTAHRAHASTVGITQYLPSYAGHLIRKEIANLSLLFSQDKHPYTLVIGGAKIDTKIDIIKNFIQRADNFLFGGGIANTFLAAQNKPMGGSLVEKEKFSTAEEIAASLQSQGKNLVLPADYVVATEMNNQALVFNLTGNLESNQKVLDLGGNSQEMYASLLELSQIIVWNGPMGVYEYEPFRAGTRAVALAIAKATKRGAITILGGGDTIDALKILGISHDQFTHVSTGGGAMLEFLEKGTLPGIEVLKK